MLLQVLPLLVPLQNLTFCLEAALDKPPYETVAIVHFNTTVDLVENIFGQLRKDRKFMWMRLNMDNRLTLEKHLTKNNLIMNVFFIHFLDKLSDWMKVYKFIMKTNFNYIENQIYVVNNHPAADQIKKNLDKVYDVGLYNSVFLFWNTSRKGFGTVVYAFNGLGQNFGKVPRVGDKCERDFYDKVFFYKTESLNGWPVNVLGFTDPPKILKTVATVNGKHEYSIGGYDILVSEVILRHLRASPYYAITDILLHYKKPENNTESRIFNVSQIARFNWTIALEDEAVELTFNSSSIDINSHRMETLPARHPIYLYPHDTDHYILIVPRRYKSKTEYDFIFKSPLLLVWAPMTAIVAIMRFLFKKIKKTDKTLVGISLETFGLSLGMSFSDTVSSAAENFLLWCFCLGTMLSGMLLSSEMFRGFALHVDILAINNLEELETSGMKTVAPFGSESIKCFAIFITMTKQVKVIKRANV